MEAKLQIQFHGLRWPEVEGRCVLVGLVDCSFSSEWLYFDVEAMASNLFLILSYGMKRDLLEVEMAMGAAANHRARARW